MGISFLLKGRMVGFSMGCLACYGEGFAKGNGFLWGCKCSRKYCREG